MNGSVSPKAIIRADAGPGIGLGHVMRSLSLGAELKVRGFECALSTSRDGLVSIPQSRLAGVEIMDPGTTPAGVELLIVDHYGLDAQFETAARSWAEFILVIEDLSGRTHDCDMLLEICPGSGLGPQVAANCLRISGPEFALLNESYRSSRNRVLPRRLGPAQRLLVTMGGTDPYGATLMALDGVVNSGIVLEVDVVLPASAPHFEAVATRVLDMNATLHHTGADLATLIGDADVCIGAAGTTAWERACLGLPTILIETAPNQRANLNFLTGAGAAIAVEPPSSEGIAAALLKLTSDATMLQEISVAASNLCDGLGAVRVADAVTNALGLLARARVAQ